MKTTNTTNQVLKHNDGKVYFPIAKITVEVAKSNASSKRSEEHTSELQSQR